CIDDTREKDAEVPESFTSVHWLRVGDPHSMRALRERVEQLLQGSSVAVEGSSLAERDPQTKRHGTRKHVIGATIALIAAAALGTAYYQTRNTEPSSAATGNPGVP